MHVVKTVKHTHTHPHTLLRHQIQNITDELKQLQSSMPKVKTVTHTHIHFKTPDTKHY